MTTRALVLTCLFLIACKDDPPQDERKAAVPTATPTTVATETAPAKAPTETLSEEAFKALHELEREAAPPPRGTTVSLGEDAHYLSLPKGEPPFPALVVIHEWWGLNDHIKHWCDRLAESGYATLAIDLYDGKTADNPDDAMALMKAVDAEAAQKTLLAGLSFLAEDGRVKAKRRGSIGWCFGGKWSLELALAAPTLDAAVVYYGQVETDPARLSALEAPLLAIFGNRDPSISAKAIERFEFGLEQAGNKSFRILRYDAEHAFANPSSARYDQESAAAAWKEVQAFLAEHLKEKPSSLEEAD